MLISAIPRLAQRKGVLKYQALSTYHKSLNLFVVTFRVSHFNEVTNTDLCPDAVLTQFYREAVIYENITNVNHVMTIRDAPTLFDEQDEKFPPETELKKQNKP